MFELDTYLNIALIISIICHAVLFFPLQGLKKIPPKKKNKGLEVTYVIEKIKSPKPMKTKLINNTPPKIGQNIPKEEPPKPKRPEPQYTTRKAVNIPQPTSQYAKIEIPPELPKDKETLYIDYYQSIREKIRHLVEKNYMKFLDYGEVCLHFVLTSDGKLLEIRVLEERSTNNPQLKEIVKRSVREASPFPPFPKDLSLKELSFNVTVSFELEE